MEISIFSTVLNMSIVGSIVIVITCILRLLFKKISKKIFLFFWLVAFFRLLCPLSLQTPFSMIPAYISSGNCLIEWAEYNADFVLLPDDAPELHTSYILVDDGLYEVFIRHNDWFIILCRIWYVILCLLVVISVLWYAILRKRLKNDTEFTSKIFEAQNHFIKSHHRIMKVAALSALLLHWFNPLVWIAFELFHLDLQMSFDEALIQKIGIDKAKSYASSLSEFYSRQLFFTDAPLPLWTNHLEKRIENILHFQDSVLHKKRIIIACFIFAMMCATNQVNTANDKNLMAFLSDASYIEVESLSNRRNENSLLLHEEADAILFQKIVAMFEDNSYTKSDLILGKEAQYSKYTFYNQKHRTIGEIIIYHETCIQVKHKLYSLETPIEIIIY